MVALQPQVGKKYKLLENFNKYLVQSDLNPDSTVRKSALAAPENPPKPPELVEGQVDPNILFIKRWRKTTQATFFILSNNSI